MLTRAYIGRGTSTVSGGGGSRVYSVDLAGSYDGVNTTLTTPEPFVAGSEVVFFNGVRQRYGSTNDYVRSESGGVGTGFDAIEFAIAPLATDILWIDYDPA